LKTLKIEGLSDKNNEQCTYLIYGDLIDQKSYKGIKLTNLGQTGATMRVYNGSTF